MFAFDCEMSNLPMSCTYSELEIFMHKVTSNWYWIPLEYNKHDIEFAW